MSKFVGVVFARMGSSRVPGKAMVDLAGRPLLWHIIDRVQRVQGLGDLIFATSTEPENEPMVELAKQLGLDTFCHPVEGDVLGRIIGAIKGREGEVILKASGDCPLIDPAVLQLMVDTAIADPEADFVSNRVDWSYPLGLSCDVVSRRATEWCDANLDDVLDREHFAEYIRDSPEFKTIPITHDPNLSRFGWTVDEPRDVEFVSALFDALYREGEVFGLEETLRYVESLPPDGTINTGTGDTYWLSPEFNPMRT
jgi:spore coat polysaccharide biosynthesis protein SpsF (cytidylyltransferase family)